MEKRSIGRLGDVTIDVAAWDGAGAQVDLSCACMFTQEMAGHTMAGGLLHLDQALDGTLTKLRSEGSFIGYRLETLLLTQVPPTVAARAILIIGLGEPQDWTPDVMRQAVATAVRFAFTKGISHAAFAPSLLDAGIDPARTEGSPAAMVAGMREALHTHGRLVALGLAEPAPLLNWTFDAGLQHLEGAAATFRTLIG